MNFLAHLFLSFDNEPVRIGNFIADAIRGNRYTHLPKAIQNGILLHREIDTFTDAHPTVRKSTKRLHKNYGHYSGVIVDIYYDHFLAKNWSTYDHRPLEDFVASFYSLLETNKSILPEKTVTLMPYMISDNWIYNYRHLEGVQKVFEGMNRRTKNRVQMNKAVIDLELHYDTFEAEFTSFFKELITFSKLKYNSICVD